MKKLACWKMCQPELSSARSNKAGACHTHITTPWIAVAVIGSVRRFHSDCSGDFQLPPSDRRSAFGRPQASTPPVFDDASSKVATSMISSCSIMCIVKLCSPASWSGDTRAKVSTVQPHRNRPAPDGRADARRDSRTQPVTKISSARPSGTSSTGSSVQPMLMPSMAESPSKR